MDKEPNAIKTNQPVAPDTNEPAVAQTEDLEAKVASLEAEKARLIEESANYKLGMLKLKAKGKDENLETNDDDERLRQIAREELANSRLAEIAKEQDVIIRKALKENKELKLAQFNKTNIPPAPIGGSNESKPVTDTLITPEQLAAFKARGWTDKDIERYKKNYQKFSPGIGGR